MAVGGKILKRTRGSLRCVKILGEENFSVKTRIRMKSSSKAERIQRCRKCMASEKFCSLVTEWP